MHVGIERAQPLHSDVLLDYGRHNQRICEGSAIETNLLEHVELGNAIPDVTLWLKHRDDDNLGLDNIV